MSTETGHILIVEDDEVNRILLGNLLQRLGLTVTAAKDGREALLLARTKQFDMVLLDIVMPEVDGYQVLEQLRADPALKNMPIVMLSGVEDSAGVVKCVKLGADDFIFKPINSVLLKMRVDSLLERKRLREKTGS